MRWKTFIILYGKYIQDNKYKISSELAWFVDGVTKTLGVFFFGFGVSIAVHLQNAMLSFTSSVVTLFMWAGKRLDYCITNLLRTLCTKFYQNRLGFVEDVTKTFWCVFSVHSVYRPTQSVYKRCRITGYLYWIKCQMCSFVLLDCTARQPLYSVILSWCITRRWKI